MRFLSIILLCCTFLHQALLASCYHVKMEGFLHFGKDFLKRFAEAKYPEKISQHYSRTKSITFNKTTSKIDDPYDYKPIKRVRVPIQQTMNVSTEDTAQVNFIYDIKYHRIREASVKLTSLGFKMKNSFDPSLKLNDIINDATDIYVDESKKYFNFISNIPVVFDIDKEFVFLDIIESTNQIFFSECRSLLNSILNKTTRSFSEKDLDPLTKEMKDTAAEEKREGLRYICDKIDICRPFPAFSDHFAELLSKVLQMSDDKLLGFLKCLEKALEVKSYFFRSIMNDEIALKIRSKLNPFIADASNSAEMFAVLRGVITNRYKIFNSKDKEIKLKTKAVRILIDIVDKTFEFVGEEFTVTSFKQVRRGITNWMIGKARKDLQDILAEFINNFFEVLKYYWEADTIQEVTVLIEIIMTGTSGNAIVRENLMTKGSRIVRGDKKISVLDETTER